jgi:hypothetical protein
MKRFDWKKNSHSTSSIYTYFKLSWAFVLFTLTQMAKSEIRHFQEATEFFEVHTPGGPH